MIKDKLRTEITNKIFADVTVGSFYSINKGTLFILKQKMCCATIYICVVHTLQNENYDKT